MQRRVRELVNRRKELFGVHLDVLLTRIRHVIREYLVIVDLFVRHLVNLLRHKHLQLGAEDAEGGSLFDDVVVLLRAQQWLQSELKLSGAVEYDVFVACYTALSPFDSVGLVYKVINNEMLY